MPGADPLNHYYEIALLGRRLSLLTYHSPEPLEAGRVVEASLQGRTVRGVVWQSCERPSFKTLPLTTLPYRYLPWQMDLARFTALYYHVSLGEALDQAVALPMEHEQTFSGGVELLEPPFELNEEQRRAWQKVRELPAALLFAPTGSGKTEIYIHRIAETLQEGKTAVLLMPEISLTPQMEKRLRRHFGEAVAIWHSKLTKKRRRQVLEAIADGSVRVVAGPRSALWLPLRELGLIVVDEEHDDSYKSHQRPRYNARDLALYLGKRIDVPVLLGSATPSPVTYARQKVVKIARPFVQTRKRYTFLGGGCRFNEEIYGKIERHLAQKGQVLVFLPTRANYKYLYCEGCGFHLTCPYCSVGMSLHRARGAVQCHYCQFTQQIPERCPQCGDIIRNDRMGTAEAAQMLRERFADRRIEQFDKDTMTTSAKLQKCLERFADKKIDILVGTQMLAKGHDYPDVTLAVIMGLDYLLALPDYRARERAMALFYQVAGRAGRRREAEVVVQTNQPHFFMAHLNDYEGFLKEEIDAREGLYPPHAHLCRLLFSGKEEEAVSRRTEATAKALARYEPLAEIVGWGKAPIERIAGKYRYQILLRSFDRTDLMRVLKAVDDGSFEIDVDPVDFA